MQFSDHATADETMRAILFGQSKTTKSERKKKQQSTNYLVACFFFDLIGEFAACRFHKIKFDQMDKH